MLKIYNCWRWEKQRSLSLGCKRNQQENQETLKVKGTVNSALLSSMFFFFLSLSQAKANTMKELGFLSSRPSVAENYASLILTLLLAAFNKYILIPDKANTIQNIPSSPE